MSSGLLTASHYHHLSTFFCFIYIPIRNIAINVQVSFQHHNSEVKRLPLNVNEKQWQWIHVNVKREVKGDNVILKRMVLVLSQ